MDFTPSGFFALRTPLLPFDEFLAWSAGLAAAGSIDDAARLDAALTADRTLLRERLRRLVARPIVREALFVASPDLEQSLPIWIGDPEGDRGVRIERALVRYFARMVGRPTPFGLFAGTSVGTISDRTRLIIEAGDRHRRRSRLDMDYLFALADAVARDPSLRKSFDVRPNSSLYRAAGRLRYVEARVDGKERTHHLVAVDDDEALQTTLERARDGASTDALAAALADEDVTTEEAAAYVNELIDSQILRPAVPVLVTGCDPSAALAAELRRCPETASIGQRIDEVRSELSAIDGGGFGTEPQRYTALADTLKELPAPVELPRLFQVDMVKQSREAQLGGAVLEEIIQGIDLLRRLAVRFPSDDLTRFREAFVARYEEREVPLVEALDEEGGIGFPPSAGQETGVAPLLKDLDFPDDVDEKAIWTARETCLLRKVTGVSRPAREIVLGPDDLEQLETKRPNALPPAFGAMGSLAAASQDALARGEFWISGLCADGPSGARLLGRFCDADPALLSHVERHLRAEEALDPEAVFAEIVHLPEGRVGNVLFRPVVREYEIPFLGDSGAPLNRQLPVSDLLVSVSVGRIVIRSARLQRRVVPRLTSAHNVRTASVGLYRFLAELQGQGFTSFLGWDWGPLGLASFLPRVVYRRLVLSPAQWHVPRAELRALGQSRGSERFRRVQAWRASGNLPRWILLRDGDNRLPIDLENVLSVESWIDLVKDRDDATVVEMFPGPDELCAIGPEGRFVHEFIVPFVRTPAGSLQLATRTAAASTSSAAVGRRFTPGSEWLFVKLYAGPSTADRLLLDILAPLVRDALDSGAIDRWFFIRYGDPDCHVRIRFHGSPRSLHSELLPAIDDAMKTPLADGQVWKFQTDTYEREIERYGGSEAIELAEQIFQADSEAVLELLALIEAGDAGADERWRLALLGIDILLTDFGLDLEDRRRLMTQASLDRAGPAGLHQSLKRGLADRLRKESRSLEMLLDPLRNVETPLSPGVDVLNQRSHRIGSFVRQLKHREEAGRLSRPLMAIVPSYVHMHVNRLIRSAHRHHEVVLYDFLGRIYQSHAIRARRGAG